MTVSASPVYLYTLNEAAGVVAANNFLSVFNPSGSGKSVVALGALYASYTAGSTLATASLLTKRITAASAGTLVSASTIARFATY